MARRPGPDFPPFFVQRLIHVHAQVCIEFGCAKWTTASLNSFTIIILNNHFDPFIRCMGVARIFQRGGHTDSYIGYSPNCHLNIVGCLLTKRLTKGGSRAPQDPPLATPLRCMLLREKCFHSLFISSFTKPEREEVHSQRCKLFSNHSLRLKISY